MTGTIDFVFPFRVFLTSEVEGVGSLTAGKDSLEAGIVSFDLVFLIRLFLTWIVDSASSSLYFFDFLFVLGSFFSSLFKSTPFSCFKLFYYSFNTPAFFNFLGADFSSSFSLELEELKIILLV